MLLRPVIGLIGLNKNVARKILYVSGRIDSRPTVLAETQNLYNSVTVQIYLYIRHIVGQLISTDLFLYVIITIISGSKEHCNFGILECLVFGSRRRKCRA